MVELNIHTYKENRGKKKKGTTSIVVLSLNVRLKSLSGKVLFLF